MDSGKQGYFENRLRHERERLRRFAEGIDETGLDASQRESTGELSLYDNHPADLGSEVFERSKDLALKSDAGLKIKAVDDALAKMKAGRYGYCDECGAEIPEERLEAIPYTTMCQHCKEKQERQGEPRKRPIEEAVLETPWAHSFDGSIMYDRDDTWQDVEQHGPSTETDPLDEEEGRDAEKEGQEPDVDQIPYYESDGVFYEDDRPKRGKPTAGGS
ncbi:MAG: conjugal transfer protein TraR [Ammonifex sp.]|nr:MAG: conjugal transfer protein TraR [Ammonifex sp.]